MINIVPTTPNLQAMLDKFNKEHWHDEDEVRFIVKGHGLFHIAPEDCDVVSIEMEAGDLIRVPRGTQHWFNLVRRQNRAGDSGFFKTLRAGLRITRKAVLMLIISRFVLALNIFRQIFKRRERQECMRFLKSNYFVSAYFATLR